jgi:hypothetical protein
MAKSPAERKAAQRARLAEAGNRKMELQLDEQELEMLARNCAARRPGRAPYEMAEYIARLICPECAKLINAWRPFHAFMAHVSGVIGPP